MSEQNRQDERPDARDPIDEELEETFPASDAPSQPTMTGTQIRPEKPAEVVTDTAVTDNTAAGRYELDVAGQIAFLVYERRPDAIAFVHTEVPPALRGRRVGDRLVEGALALARAEGTRVIPLCPFVRKYLQKHPEQA